MARPRTPMAVAEASGAIIKDPQRYRDRAAPQVDALGDPPEYLTELQRECWHRFVKSLPWLTDADSFVLEAASVLRASLMEDSASFPISGFAQLRLYLASMGATPVDRSKIVQSDDEKEDPADKFLN